MPEASAHEEDLRLMAYRLIDAAGLQRGRLTGLVLKAEDLADAGQIAQRISLDRVRDARLAAERGRAQRCGTAFPCGCSVSRLRSSDSGSREQSHGVAMSDEDACDPAVDAEIAGEGVPCVTPDPADRGTILLSRAPEGWRDLLRRYEVLIDGAQVGRIGRGETLRFDVAPGVHRLQLKIAWCSSAPMTVVAEAGKTASFFCAPGGGPSDALTSVTVGAGEYIALRQTPEPIAVVKASLDWRTRFLLGIAFGFFGGSLTLIGALIWRVMGAAPDVDNDVVGVSFAVTLACMLAFRLTQPRKARQRRRG